MNHAEKEANMAGAREQEPHGTHQTRKATASGWIGSALEYYDFFIYAQAAALIFPQIFFPSGNPTVAIVASLATYGVGYVARPIGAFVLGHWGDTHGRKTVLLLCMFLMGFSTMAVGVLPTYQHVGILAPLLLVILRLIQGFAVAGEISGASSMVLEHAPFGRRGFYASFALQGVQAGQILAAAVFLPIAAYMSPDAFISWGWRVPFLASFFVIIAGYIIQGFAVAGEISGASSMVLEHAPFGRRGFYASFALQGVQAGQILAAAVFLPIAAYMSPDAFISWGWRVPFLASFFVIIAGYII